MGESDLFVLMFTGIWCLVGAIFLAVGIGLRRSFARREERLRARTEGRVADVFSRTSYSGSSRSVSWYPVIAFEAEGLEYELEYHVGGSRRAFSPGQSVEVLYDPDDPTCFRLEGHATTRLLGTVFLLTGLACVAVGVIVGLSVHAFSQGIHIH